MKCVQIRLAVYTRVRKPDAVIRRHRGITLRQIKVVRISPIIPKDE